jgi:hypothetical protein
VNGGDSGDADGGGAHGDDTQSGCGDDDADGGAEKPVTPDPWHLGDGNLREKRVAQGIGTTEETPYIVSSIGRYGREEKMMIKIKIWGSNNVEYSTTAVIDCGASENFIDKAYTAANGIPT